MAYKLDWSGDNRSVVVYEAYNPRCFGLREKKYTDEEKELYRAESLELTDVEKLRRLFRETFLMSWKITELAYWMEENTQGYDVNQRLDGDVQLIFHDPKDAMLFKLTWA